MTNIIHHYVNKPINFNFLCKNITKIIFSDISNLKMTIKYHNYYANIDYDVCLTKFNLNLKKNYIKSYECNE